VIASHNTAVSRGRGLRGLIASFGQNIITVLSETTHAAVMFDRNRLKSAPNVSNGVRRI
jgi:hypothetical protein